MNRGNLLSITRKFLEAKSLTQGICEAKVMRDQMRSGKFPQIKHQRLMVLTGVQNPQDVATLCNNRDLLMDVHSYPDLQSYENNYSFTPVDVDPTYNWRGRVLRFGTDFDLNTSQVDFEKTFLKSYWRFILTQRENQFYANHDLTPVFYHPGSSTVGQDSPLPGVMAFLKYIYIDYSTQTPGRFDPDYDYVVLYGKKEGNVNLKKFSYAEPGEQSKDEWTHREFCALIQATGTDLLAAEICRILGD